MRIMRVLQALHGAMKAVYAKRQTAFAFLNDNSAIILDINPLKRYTIGGTG